MQHGSTSKIIPCQLMILTGIEVKILKNGFSKPLEQSLGMSIAQSNRDTYEVSAHTFLLINLPLTFGAIL